MGEHGDHHNGDKCSGHHGSGNGHRGPTPILDELRDHLPFSVSAVAIGLIVAGAICIIGFASLTGPSGQGATDVAAQLHDADEAADHHHADDGAHMHDPARKFFHLFHPAHMLFSAAATSAMFCRYERKYLKAIVIGLIGAIGVCGISDIAMPHVSLILLGAQTPLHVCIWEHPGLAFPFAAVGVLVGVSASMGVVRSTVISHSLHVFTSTMASIFYMVGPLGMVDWIDIIGRVFFFVILAVMVPCCLSDIVFPVFMSKAGRSLYSTHGHTH